MAVDIKSVSFHCRQEALDYDAINCSLNAFVQSSTTAFYISKEAGDYVVDDSFTPIVVFFTSVPSETYAPRGAFRVYVVGTTSEEIDIFFASQFTLLNAALDIHPTALKFAAMQCQHSALKYLMLKLGLLGRNAVMSLSLLKTLNGRNSEHMSTSLLRPCHWDPHKDFVSLEEPYQCIVRLRTTLTLSKHR